MASTFRPVNSPLTVEVEKRDGIAASPTTPTPTTATLNQRPLPNSPFPQAVRIPEREASHHSQPSHGSDDIDMNSDRETRGNADSPRSDEGSTGDGSKSHKKKKSQRFYCTEYPPCNLSFTRSEHLARHIRKHTGERPFQCHCSRRFSRLDNLRQHAQTVHVNEDIPMDSLAATGTRFQRQIRTERVRQPGRARAATAGNMGVPVRGHSKSLSTSNIGSVGPGYSPREDVRRHLPPLIMADPQFQFPVDPYNPVHAHAHQPPSPNDYGMSNPAMFSARGMGAPVRGHSKSLSTSSISPSPREDLRRHPPPLIVADHHHRASFSGDVYPHTHAHQTPSPCDFSTPTSATFSPGQNSPRWGPAMPSPTLSHSRSHSMYAGPRAPIPARRLSVPTGMLSYQPQYGPNVGRPIIGRGPVAAYGGSGPVVQYPSANSALASPTSSSFTQRDSTPGSDERRKTWHEGSRIFGASSSGLSHVITPSEYPSPPQNRADHMGYHPDSNARVRLPGIESFDPLPHRPASPMRRNASPTDRMVHPNVSGFQGFPTRELPLPESAPRQGDIGEREKLIRLNTLVALAASESSATTAF
ncbi:hypothetical protein GGS21DRAFT_532522 [Xylaria nigripes]|nr:hypothetical protein GGS21DRAFT_532522 [Xylaria nigripes]